MDVLSSTPRAPSLSSPPARTGPRARCAGLDDDLGAGASWQKMRSILKPRFLVILLIFQIVRIQAKTKYFRKAEFDV
jgi:hypothetical protein